MLGQQFILSKFVTLTLTHFTSKVSSTSESANHGIRGQEIIHVYIPQSHLVVSIINTSHFQVKRHTS